MPKVLIRLLKARLKVDVVVAIVVEQLAKAASPLARARDVSKDTHGVARHDILNPGLAH